MSTITKTGDNNNAPAWLDGLKATEKRPVAPSRIEPFPKDLDEETLVAEMDLVEKCASEGRPYFYRSDWPEDEVSQLREFACACGTRVEADEMPEEVPAAPAEEPMPKVASTSAKVMPVADMGSIVGDPFHLADLTPETRTPKERQEARKAERIAEWQKVSPEQKTQHPDVMMTANSIITIPGGDNPMVSRAVGVGRGENSIASPDAIGELAKTEDSGERLHAAVRQHRTERKAEKKLWEKEMVEKAKVVGPGALPRGSVFMTESMNAQPGLRGEVFPTKEDVPDRTAGEMLKQKTKEHRASISRPAGDKNAWQAVQGASRHEISDVFAQELKKRLGVKAE